MVAFFNEFFRKWASVAIRNKIIKAVMPMIVTHRTFLEHLLQARF